MPAFDAVVEVLGAFEREGYAVHVEQSDSVSDVRVELASVERPRLILQSARLTCRGRGAARSWYFARGDPALPHRILARVAALSGPLFLVPDSGAAPEMVVARDR